MILRSPTAVTTPTVTFWGAARAVTGSMHLVEAAGRLVLLDCGLTPRGRAEPQAPPQFPFDPRDVDAVILSHAHIDHCGNLPHLVHQGFAGPIYCTAPTRDLTEVMLADSARIQEENAAVARTSGRVNGAGTREAGQLGLTRSVVRQTVAQCVTVEYDEPFAPAADLQARQLNAGHLLGSAMVALTAAGPYGEKRITFTGDLGRRGTPMLHPPGPVPAADLIICESTYGGRIHEAYERTIERLDEVMRRTLERGGKVLIPAFSLGRTQLVVHTLEGMIRDGRLAGVPVFVDSPLAAQFVEVYRRYPQELGLPPDRDGTPDTLDESDVTYVRTHEESKNLSERTEPCVVVASGGMCDAGRILNHLRRHIDDPRCSLVLVSYQAPNTLGARLLERGPTVQFHGRTWNKWFDVVRLDGFSGHAGQDDFRALLGPAVAQTGKVRLVHGEPAQAEALAKALRADGFADVAVPARGESAAAV
jgi:metallo-beta-lactamase family protein